jgi:hypothetical protein
VKSPGVPPGEVGVRSARAAAAAVALCRMRLALRRGPDLKGLPSSELPCTQHSRAGSRCQHTVLGHHHHQPLSLRGSEAPREHKAGRLGMRKCS